MYTLILALIPTADNSTFEITTAGEVLTAKLLRLNPDFTATAVTRTGEVQLKDVVGLRRSGQVIPPLPTGPQLMTAYGDRLAAEFQGLDRTGIRIRPTLFPAEKRGVLTVPTSAATVLWLTSLPAELPLDAASYPWLQDNRNRDILRTRNDDLIRGIILGPEPDAAKPGLRIRPDIGEPRTLNTDQLTAIAFNPLLARSRLPKGAYARVVLIDGSRLSLTSISMAAGLLSGETLFGAKWEAPLESVASLLVLQGKATYLSDMKPRKLEQTSYLGVSWPPQTDRTVRGKALHLSSEGGITSLDKGLGTHPRCRITYDLGSKYRRFEALVGLDPDSGDRGQAVLRVFVDGKEQKIEGFPNLGSGKAVEVRIDVVGAGELTLEVDFGPAGDVRADVNWGLARLIE
jgi:hypothetical protein